VDGATYDASGNLTRDPPGNPVRHSYTYDAENRLTGIPDQGITYNYDAEGKRIGVYGSGTLTKSFLRDQDQSSFITFDGAGNLSSLDLFAAGRHIFCDTGGYWATHR
jgi:YD repeat-containing protein